MWRTIVLVRGYELADGSKGMLTWVSALVIGICAMWGGMCANVHDSHLVTTPAGTPASMVMEHYEDGSYSWIGN